MVGAATGVCFPIGLSYLLLYLGFGYGPVETFITGAALSATSLGTTFAVISSASSTINLAQTRIGSVLVSAAVIDDVIGLVMSSVIGNIGKIEGDGDINLGWLIGRPIVASIGMALVTPVVTKYVFAPVFRQYIEYHFARFDHISNIILMTLVLSAFISTAAFTGTSVLFGSFLAGTFLSYLPSKHPKGPFVVMSREDGEREADKSPTFVHTFECYLLDVQKYLMEPLFFASVGFAIPFVQLWTGERIWRGIFFTLLMIFAKTGEPSCTSCPTNPIHIPQKSSVSFLCSDTRLGPTPLPTQTPLLASMLPGYDRFGGKCAEEFLDSWWRSTHYARPSGDGFTRDKNGKEIKQLREFEKGTLLDKVGGPDGKYLAPFCDPIANRSIPPSNLSPRKDKNGTIQPIYYAFEVLTPFSAYYGQATPFFNQPGSGQHIALTKSIQELVTSKTLKQLSAGETSTLSCFHASHSASA
ncbi:Hsp70 ATPase ssc1 [Aspergillus hancockii]|nr:Hsp70 ATPase ssc1 [Aspergillus hancockii]